MGSVAGRIPHGDVSRASTDSNAVVLIDYGDVLEKDIFGFYVETIRASTSLESQPA